MNFLCVLAYHLLAAMEKRFLEDGIHTSWWTLRQQLSTHQVITIVLPTADGRALKIRKGIVERAMRHTSPETKRRYQLGMAEQVRQAVEKSNERLYGRRKVLHFCDSPMQVKKEEAIAVCN